MTFNIRRQVFVDKNACVFLIWNITKIWHLSFTSNRYLEYAIGEEKETIHEQIKAKPKKIYILLLLSEKLFNNNPKAPLMEDYMEGLILGLWQG